MTKISAIVAVLLVSTFTVYAKGSQENATASGAQSGNTASQLRLYANPTAYHDATGKTVGKYAEAPSLDALVSSGKLPTVEKRLPDDPLVVQPSDSIGTYGGTMRQEWGSANDVSQILVRDYFEPFIRYDNQMHLVGDVAESWETSADGTQFTFHLRKGMKWSDGQPFTANDVMYYYNDILMNNQLTPLAPSYILQNGKAGALQKIDDYTVRFVFDEPNGMFIEQFAAPGGGHEFYAPMHYLRQFDPKYVSVDTLNKMAKDKGFDTWVQLFEDRDDANGATNVDMPTLRAYMVTTPLPATRTVLKRNPYYFAIDTAGNQLPYVDETSIDLVPDLQVLNLKASSGEVDFQNRLIDNFANYTLFQNAAQKGGYHVVRWGNLENAALNFTFSQTYSDDPVVAKLIQNVDFRKALSVAINRKEMSQIVFNGVAVPGQASPSSWDRYFDAGWLNSNIEYDPAKANQLLDGIGLAKKNADGIRLRPDGKPLQIVLEGTDYISVSSDLLQLVAGYWKAVGVDTVVKMELNSIYFERLRSDKIPIKAWACGGPFYELLPVIVPIRPGSPDGWGDGYAVWLGSGGTHGVKPAGDAAKMFNLYDQLVSTIGDAAKAPIIKQMEDLMANELWWVGTVGQLPDFAIVNNSLMNVPVGIPSAYYVLTPRNAEPEQFYFKK